MAPVARKLAAPKTRLPDALRTGASRAARSARAGGARWPFPGAAPTVRPGRASDRFYREMVESMRTGVLAIDRRGRVTVLNELAGRILGLSCRTTGLGRPFVEVLDAHRDLARVLGNALEVEHPPNRAELRLAACGKVIGYTLSVVRDAQGHALGAAIFFKDLTRVEQLEERERLRDRLAALGEMAAAIAHEVKNPLASIEVTAGVLKRRLPASPEAQAALGDIIHEAKMANAIVQEVLQFVRPLRLHVEPVHLLAVIHEAVATSSASRPDHVQLRLALPDDLPPIQGDPLQLRQLFVNLLVNAFEAVPDGTVEVGACQVTGEVEAHHGDPQETTFVVIEIADDGPGIPSALRDRIFNPFFSTKPRGSGLGLAIVQRLVDAHDGRIDLADRPGGGTRFRVTLPVSGADRGWTEM